MSVSPGMRPTSHALIRDERVIGSENGIRSELEAGFCHSASAKAILPDESPHRNRKLRSDKAVVIACWGHFDKLPPDKFAPHTVIG